MSRLYFTEQGRVISTLGEELTIYRRARKVLNLPVTKAPATLYFLAQPYAGSGLPLHISVNGVEIPAVRPGWHAAYSWYEVLVEPRLLKPGANVFNFWTDATAMNAWSLAMEGGHRNPDSHISDDSGATWRNEAMGYLNVLNGEYTVRVRLAEGSDNTPPLMVWEDTGHRRLAHLRQIMPAEAVKPGPQMRRVRALLTWLSTSWQHTSSAKAAQYAPWDAETILSWGNVRLGHDGRTPVVMCVQYGLAMTMCCQAIGLSARCLIGTRTLGSADGHFAAEVWMEEYGKWVLADANADAIFCKQGVPLSVSEIRAEGQDLAHLIEWGPGAEFQRRYPSIDEFVVGNYVKGLWLQHRSLWPRTDFFSHPELTSPGHGGTVYSETNLVWETRDLQSGFGMFPYFADQNYFDAPPNDMR